MAAGEKWRGFRAMLAADMRIAIRDLTALMFSLALPLFLLIFFFLLGASGEVGPIRALVVDQDRSSASETLLARLEASPHLAVEVTTEYRRADLVITVPPGFASALAENGDAATTVRLESRLADRATVLRAEAALRSALGAAEREVRGRDPSPGLRVEVLGRRAGAVASLVPGLVGMVLVTGVFAGSVGLATLRKGGVLKHLRATPARPSVFLLARSLAAAVWLLLASAPLVVVARVLDIRLTPNYAAALTVGAFAALTFLALGSVIALYIGSFSAVSRVASMAVMPMVLLGDTFYRVPPDWGWASTLARLLPLTHVNRALRAVLNEGAGWIAIVPHLTVVAAWFAGCVVLVLRRSRGMGDAEA